MLRNKGKAIEEDPAGPKNPRLTGFRASLLFAYSIANHGAPAWQRPHPYVGSHRPTAPQQYGGWNPGAAPSDAHCARVSSIEQKSVPGPAVG